MVTGNENTFKLIYSIQENIRLMVIIFDISGMWSNGPNRSFRWFDPDDDKIEVRAAGNMPCIDSNGNCTIYWRQENNLSLLW